MDLLTSFRIVLSLSCLITVASAQIPEDPFDKIAQEAEIVGGESHQFIDPDLIRNLTGKVKPSIVAVRQLGRDGDQRGIGSGFVIDKSGLIATNLHVIGESRPVEVEFNDGSVFPVTEIHSSDRRFDLAVLRIDPGDRELVPLKLGETKALDQGELIVGFGSPLGLKFSVVSGVVSAIRNLEADFLGEETPDYPMIQISMPIELGNSGGPIVNLNGEVMGVVTFKHRIRDNLGFAVKSDDLSTILKKPNPVPMARWKTIGTLDPRQWSVVMDGDWNQRSGVIQAKTPGSGFGGRTLCLSEETVPDGPFEIAVKVKLDDESGAAGLAFSSDGGDEHYGFYPSNGKLRLTRFNGPSVYSWKILVDKAVPAYESGEWNHLKIRVEDGVITGYVNGEEAVKVKDSGLTGTKAGLCKFRKTNAQFREFEIADQIEFTKLSEKQSKAFDLEIEKYVGNQDRDSVLSKLAENDEVSRIFLDQKAAEFEALALEMRNLKSALHYKSVATDLLAVVNPADESEIDLFEVALQLARIDDPEMDEDHYRKVFARLVSDGRIYLDGAKDATAVRKLRDFLFKENGFHGSRNEYYHHANSYINHVLDDREGLPITLSVLFIGMAQRLDLGNVFGVGLPGRFVVGYQEHVESDLILFNVFENGLEMTRRDAEIMATQFGGRTTDATFEPAHPKAIAMRMLRNLIGLEINQKQNPPGALSYLNLLLEIEPEAIEARFQRALVQAQTENFEGAKQDLDWLLEKRPAGINYNRLLQFREALE